MRVIVLVIDGLGVGEMDDVPAIRKRDINSNTIQHNIFKVKGFQNWKRVNCDPCPLKKHEGVGNSLHNAAMQK